MTHEYDGIRSLPHHVSDKHPQMTLQNRAAQFAPFAALSGYGAAIAETGRLTDRKVELDESEQAVLNEKLVSLHAREKSLPAVRITYFLPDKKKYGGAYPDVTGNVRRVDVQRKTLTLTCGTVIPFGDIVAIAEET